MNGAMPSTITKLGINANTVAIAAPQSPCTGECKGLHPATKPMNVTTRISGPGVASPMASASKRSLGSNQPRRSDSSRAHGTTAYAPPIDSSVVSVNRIAISPPRPAARSKNAMPAKVTNHKITPTNTTLKGQIHHRRAPRSTAASSFVGIFSQKTFASAFDCE